MGSGRKVELGGKLLRFGGLTDPSGTAEAVRTSNVLLSAPTERERPMASSEPDLIDSLPRITTDAQHRADASL